MANAGAQALAGGFLPWTLKLFFILAFNQGTKLQSESVFCEIIHKAKGIGSLVWDRQQSTFVSSMGFNYSVCPNIVC